MTDKKNVLITNDDGIEAAGISALAEAFSKVANVYIVAPEDQRSCTGHSITMDKPVRITEVEHPHAVRAFKTSGFPADCVKMGLHLIEERVGAQVDCVLSGINMGPNVGTDAAYSGTIGGALEGGISRKTAIAVSQDSYVVSDYSYACELAVKVFEKLETMLDRKMVISINVPDLPKEEIKGVKFAKMSYRDYEASYDVEEDERGTLSYMYTGDPVIFDDTPADSDVIAIQNGYATVTPITYLITDHELFDEVKDWKL